MRPCRHQVRLDVVGRDEVAAGEERTRARGLQERERSPRAHSELDVRRTAHGAGEAREIGQEVGSDVDVARSLAEGADGFRRPPTTRGCAPRAAAFDEAR